MPIHYASILNARNTLVLQGVYERTQTIFKTQVIQNAYQIKRFGFSKVPLDQTLYIMFQNWDSITAAIVVSNEVDLQECGEFLDAFKNHVEVNMLGKKPGYEAPTMNASGASAQEDTTDLYRPFQASTAESAFRQF